MPRPWQTDISDRYYGISDDRLGDAYRMCAQMSRIDSQHLLWVLDNLGRGRVINRVTVEPCLQRAAGLAVDRMLGLGGGCGMSGGPIPSN